MKKKVLAFTMAVLMLGTLALTGCQKEEAPIAADKVAVALFEMILKNDASSAVELFGYASEEDARKDMGLDGDLYDEMAEEMVSQFSSMGFTASTEDVQTFIDAFMSMFKDVTMTAVVKSSDEKSGKAVVTCTISTFDPNALNDAMTEAMTEAISDPDVVNSGDTDAAFSLMLNAISSAIADLTPTGETTDFDVDFELSTLSINGKDRKAWVPVDANAFGNAISTNSMGG